MALQEKDNHNFLLQMRCIKNHWGQLKELLQVSAITETELRGELNCIQKQGTQYKREVQKSALESQLQIAKWNDSSDQVGNVGEEDLSRQLMNTQREKAELKGKVEALNEKVRFQNN